MTPVSRRSLPKESLKRIEGLLISELCRINQPEKFEPLIEALLTESERVMLAKRMAVFVMAENGISDTDIASSLNLTRVTTAKLRLTYQLAREQKSPVAETVQNKQLWETLKPMLKKFLIKYALPAAMGRIPR
jgi:Trp operon repressor